MSAKNAVDLLPSELKAIEEHKYYMSMARGERVTIDEAVGDFARTYRGRWLQERQRQDTKEQLREIEKHRWYRSEEAGHDVGKGTAAEEWIRQFASGWREARESLEANGFRTFVLILGDRKGIQSQAGQKLSEIALAHDCDIYVHWTGMECYSFVMAGKPFLDAKSACFRRQFDTAAGGEIEIIATGVESQKAMEDIECLVATLP